MPSSIYGAMKQYYVVQVSFPHLKTESTCLGGGAALMSQVRQGMCGVGGVLVMFEVEGVTLW